MTKETSPKFGTSEESVDVAAAALVPGVRVDGYRFGFPSTVVIQSVVKVHVGRRAEQVRVEVADFESGRVDVRYLRTDRPITCWGRI